MKKTLALLLSFVVVVCSGCSTPSGLKAPPSVSINVMEQKLAYIVRQLNWNGKKNVSENPFVTMLKPGSGVIIPEVELPKKVTFEFANDPPKKIKVYDNILKSDGSLMYTKKETIEIPVTLENGKGSFDVVQHTATKESNLLRGYTILCSWGSDECEYAVLMYTK